ncbi:hypothetical protein Sango_1555400 [Sesamum angolense]|uniref:Uncharacterized protein n=1 Tax=Sesamum angolense TaxID=2727404 RepID=A0AAE2BTM9_9LAMI|nr:hypothetical protein Sango_1555400 [Sesamum angolense]
MSLENEDQRSPDKGSTEFDVVLKKPKITYPREFLLSLSNLDICKKLPSGFDESLLCEFEDAIQSTQDRPRNPGSLPLQGFRRNEYGSSPPTRGDSSNYSRGIYGKWDSRSSGRNDRDSDSQSDRESDSGRRYGHHARRSWQTSEQDGLLGSGSFPRPSGYAGGIAAPKVRANEHYQLTKSTEPYHPPRPYKAVPYSRRDTDAYNDETFGSTECSNEDKAEEERRRREPKPVDDTMSTKPSSLLSLIVSGDKDRYQVTETEATQNIPCDLSNKTSKQYSKLTLDMPSAADGVSDQACIDSKQGTIPTVLTCEDLEQSILIEYSAKTKNPLLNGWSTTDTNTEQPSEHVNDHASVHLLSLLQKGTDKSNVTLNSGVDITMFEKPLISQENDMGSTADEPKGEDHCKNDLKSGKTLTLETLFGSAFMKELQSVGAPVSIQRSSTGSAEVDTGDPHGLPFPVINNEVSSSAIDKAGLQELSHDHRVFASNHGQQIKMSTAENWLGFDGFQIGTTSPKHHPEAVPKHGGLEEAVGFQLPEENIIPVTDPRNHRMSTFVPTHNPVNNVNFSSNMPINVMDKLAAANAVKDERFMSGPESLPFVHGPFGNMEPEFPYHNLPVQQSSPEFQPPQMAQVRPSYNQLESHLAHMSSQMKFLGPEPMFNHDFPASHQFPSAMNQHPFHRPNIGVSGFDGPSHHSMLHQMQMPGNRTPHVLPDLPRGGPAAHHGNRASGFIQEMNQIQGFPFGPLQPNIGSDGFPIPAPDMHSGSNPPEAFQRLIEMELQANSKHIHPFATGHNQGVYGHEIDMGFRYR